MSETVLHYSIIGGGGFGAEIAGYLGDINKNKKYICKIWDNFFNHQAFRNVNCIYAGNIENIKTVQSEVVLICIGNCERRAQIADFLKRRNIRLGRFIHPSSIVSSSAKIQDGCIILPYTSVSVDAEVGYNSVLNSHVAIGHHAKIGDHCVISPQTLVAGNAVIGDECFLGAGVMITPGKKIGKLSKISAGSVVYRNAQSGAFLLGNPAKNFSKRAADE